jgi:hypothetical protein
MPDTPDSGPRPPEGDWLGTPYLSFKREGPFAICTLDRPQTRNAMTPAMYFGIRYAIIRVNAEPDLAGLLITGTGDMFAPGGDLGQGGEDNWMDFASTMGMDVDPVLGKSLGKVLGQAGQRCLAGGIGDESRRLALHRVCGDVNDSGPLRLP